MSRIEQIKMGVAFYDQLPAPTVKGNFKLEKISDDVFGNNHPNGYNEGYSMAVDSCTEIVVGVRPTFYDNDRWFMTSMVTEILSKTENETVFKTLNSTYKLTKWEA